MESRKRMVWDEIGPETECCENCRHFHRHYVVVQPNPNAAVPTNFGHCVYPRLKDRMIYDVCQHFEKR